MSDAGISDQPTKTEPLAKPPHGTNKKGSGDGKGKEGRKRERIQDKEIGKLSGRGEKGNKEGRSAIIDIGKSDVERSSTEFEEEGRKEEEGTGKERKVVGREGRSEIKARMGEKKENRAEKEEPTRDSAGSKILDRSLRKKPRSPKREKSGRREGNKLNKEIEEEKIGRVEETREPPDEEEREPITNLRARTAPPEMEKMRGKKEDKKEERRRGTVDK